MNHKTKRYHHATIALYNFLFLCLVACSSIPLPDHQDQSLVVIPVILDHLWMETSTGIKTLDYVTLTIRELTSKGEIDNHPARYKASATPSDLYVTVALSKGIYAIDSVRVNYHGEKAFTGEDVYSMGYNFYVESNSVQLGSQALILSANDDIWYSVDFRGAITAAQKSNILDSIKRERFWPAWSGCQLVNFN